MKFLRTFLVTILLISILITSLFLCSCHDNDEPNNQDWIKIHNYNYLYLKQDNCSAIIKSVEDITYICDEDTSPIFKKNSYEQNKKIITTLKEYDEEFFEEKSLIVLFRFRSSSGYFFYVKDFEIIDNSFNITLARDLPKESVVYPLLVVTSVYLLEFPKEQVKDVTQINVQEILIQQ
ncbi:MAG: hypothetical protein HFE34_01360 [Clostridia bacterium]|nr:hypothetical protein [Clostridia bacterium]